MFLSLAIAALSDPDVAAAATRQVARQECRLRDEDDAITVCGRRDVQKRYQVTDPNAPFDPTGNVDSVPRERSRWIEHGDAGIGSCSAVGPGGWTGCKLKEWRAERQQKGWYW